MARGPCLEDALRARRLVDQPHTARRQSAGAQLVEAILRAGSARLAPPLSLLKTPNARKEERLTIVFIERARGFECRSRIVRRSLGNNRRGEISEVLELATSPTGFKLVECRPG